MLMTIGGAQINLDDSGCGEPIVLLHAAASSGVQWLKAKTVLNTCNRVLIPDLLGEGRSPGLEDWSDLLEKETRLIRALIESTGGPAHVVGHSYGGVIAMRLAAQYPHLFSSLILIEPVAFQLLKTYPRNEDYAKLLAVKDACSSALENSDEYSAARFFVSYWSGKETWNNLTRVVQNALAKGMKKVVRGWQLIFSDPGQISDFRKIRTPTLVVSGDRSPLPIQWVAHQLAMTIPAAAFVQIKNAGHMSPITHGTEIISMIQTRIQKTAAMGNLLLQEPERLWTNAEYTGRGTRNVELGIARNAEFLKGNSD